ncbi:MAG: TonB-dependent receptor, partial [Bacteroidales bacterium]|nr:TonB-dependent receptor [Bacteroidales bacterium]
GYAVIYFNPFENTSISLLNNYTGSMLVPHFAGGFDNNGNLIETDELVKTDDFFEFGFNFSQSFKITNQFKIQFNAGVKNIFNSYQNDFDIGINRDAGYIYGPLLPRTFTFGFKLGRFI